MFSDNNILLPTFFIGGLFILNVKNFKKYISPLSILLGLIVIYFIFSLQNNSNQFNFGPESSSEWRAYGCGPDPYRNCEAESKPGV